MKLTEIGKDVITINEENVDQKTREKIHLIHLDFMYPNILKMNKIFNNFQKTNRFIVSGNIKIYNKILKSTTKKYYVMNNTYDNIISFFKRNNKVILNTFLLNEWERQFLENKSILEDVLYNLEIIVVNKQYFEKFKPVFLSWQGNVIISNDGELE